MHNQGHEMISNCCTGNEINFTKTTKICLQRNTRQLFRVTASCIERKKDQVFVFQISTQCNQDKLISLRPIGRGSGSNVDVDVDVDFDFVVVFVVGVVGIDVDDDFGVDFILSLMLFSILL